MGHVSSVRVTAAEGARLAKGEELGHFLYGGSDTALLIQAKANVTLSVEEKMEHLAGEVRRRALKRQECPLHAVCRASANEPNGRTLPSLGDRKI